MGRCLFKMSGEQGDFYLDWSSVVDAPVTFGMTLEELKQYIVYEYGQEGLKELPARLERIEANDGTSSYVKTSVSGLIAVNRAGKNETRLTYEQMYDWYCVRQEDCQEEGARRWEELDG